jgi:hypothetical protein
VKYIISDLARIAKRTIFIIPWATVFQELGTQFDPVQLIELHQQLHCISCRDDWQEFATCIGKIRQALGTADLGSDHGPGSYIVIYSQRDSKTLQCILDDINKHGET